MSMLNKVRNDNGFTLLEVLIALAIMVVTFAAILMVESGSLNATGRARQMDTVGMLAKNIMVETELAFEGKPFEELKEEESENFKEPFAQYKWTRSIKEIKFPNLASVGLGGSAGAGTEESNDSGGGDASQANYLAQVITNFLSKAIREVTVTVSWMDGNSEQRFSLTTYWVNLNNELSVTP